MLFGRGDILCYLLYQFNVLLLSQKTTVKVIPLTPWGSIVIALIFNAKSVLQHALDEALDQHGRGMPKIWVFQFQQLDQFRIGYCFPKHQGCILTTTTFITTSTILSYIDGLYLIQVYFRYLVYLLAQLIFVLSKLPLQAILTIVSFARLVIEL